MEPFSQANNAGPDEDISSLVSEYFDRRQAGENLTPEQFLAEHAEAADTLRPYLAGLPMIENACSPTPTAVSGITRDISAELGAVEGFELHEEIGRGGMGVVYKALQLSTKRTVAFKVMLAGPFASSSARRRFDREVELAARLQHAGIVRVLESGHVGQEARRYYAMDYVAGVRLDRYLSTTQPDIRTTLGIFERICEAVDYAHRHGVIHRDLKPGNVLIDEEGSPHVLDFGLAKATDQADSDTGSLSSPGAVLGTLFYLSPEQAAGTPDEIDARTDVFSLGVMLFEALTGSLPCDATGRPSETIQRIMESPPTRPSSLSSEVDDDLETILLKALEKERARRYQSPKELAEDFRRYLRGEPIMAKRPSSLYVLRKKLRKHRLAVAATGLAVALIVVALVAGVWRRERDLTRGRRSAARQQRMLEAGETTLVLGPASALSAQHPDLVEARLVWAQTLYRNQEPDKAIRFLERELDDHPARWACRALLAEIYRATGDAERAEALQTLAEREAPDTAEGLYVRSFTTCDPLRAIRYVEECVRRKPSHARAWERLSHLRLQVGDLDGALRGAEQLIALEPDYAEWYVTKGRILDEQGRLREAIDEYTRSINIGAARGPYRDRAYAYRRLKQYDKALADYDRLVEVWPDGTTSVWDIYQRATPLWILGQTDDALKDYKRVRSLLGKPYYSDARRFLILREQGRADEAREILAAAIRDAEDPSWLLQIFRCLAGQLTPAELVADGAARNSAEQLCEACYYAGEICLLENRLAEARQWFEQCVQTGVAFDPDAGVPTPMNEHELAEWRLKSFPSREP